MHYHLSCPEGLARHSLNVYNILLEKNRYLKLGLLPSTLAITSLCHDLCKIGVYFPDDEEASSKQKEYLATLTDGKDGNLSTIKKGNASKLIDYYLSKKKGLNVGDKPIAGSIYKLQDTFPFGHGEKSAYLLTRYYDATPLEILMVRHHMGQYNFSGKDAGNIYTSAVEMYPAVVALYTADYEASQILESPTYKPVEVQTEKKDWVKDALIQTFEENKIT
jgi:hypothetical protein